jgi:hypothetical protein
MSGLLYRYEHVDSELGIVTEPEDLPEDLYPFQLVDTSAEGGGPGIKGSCASYATRTKLETGKSGTVSDPDPHSMGS